MRKSYCSGTGSRAVEGKMEKISTVLAGVNEEYKKTVKSLNNELVEKASLVKQLKTARSELQLELDRLCAQNLSNAHGG